MGYTVGTGTEGLDTFNNTPQTVADLNRLVALLSQRGNLRKGTTAERDALTGAALYEGLHFYDRTLKALMLYTGAGWVMIATGPQTGVVTPNAGANYSLSAGSLLMLQSGLVTFHGGFSHATHTPAAAGVQLGTIPAGFRPAQRVSTAAVLYGSGQLASVDITSAGAVELNNYAGVGAVLTVEFLATYRAA